MCVCVDVCVCVPRVRAMDWIGLLPHLVAWQLETALDISIYGSRERGVCGRLALVHWLATPSQWRTSSGVPPKPV